MAFTFSPNELHRLNRLAFSVRTRPTEATSGDRRVRRSGDGFDFLDFRPYSRGDDVRKVDWNLYGRFRQLFVRVHEAPRQTAISFLLDASASMAFGEPRRKIAQAQLLACGLSFVALRGGDRVYVAAMQQPRRPIRGPVSGVRRHGLVVDELQTLECGGPSQLLLALQSLAQRRLHRGLVVIVSDFLGTGDTDAVLGVIASAGGTALGVQVLSEQDHATSLKPGVVRLQDSETAEVVLVRIDEHTIAQYQEQFRVRQAALRHCFTRRGFQLIQIDVTDDYLSAISRVLTSGVIRP